MQCAQRDFLRSDTRDSGQNGTPGREPKYDLFLTRDLHLLTPFWSRSQLSMLLALLL